VASLLRGVSGATVVPPWPILAVGRFRCLNISARLWWRPSLERQIPILYHEITLGVLLEGVAVHAFDGQSPSLQRNLERIRDLEKRYDFDLNSRASHRLREMRRPRRSKAKP